MQKRSARDLAIFAGAPLFDRPRPIGQLDAPAVEDYLRLLKVPFASRHLTNAGPLVQRLEERLCDYHGVRHCIAVANAGLGLMMLAQLFANGRKGEVILPAFSYRGLPHFVQWAGQSPRFCDVHPETHCLDPEYTEAVINEKTTSILSVCNFNSPGHIDELCHLGSKYDMRVFLDSVYGMGCSYKGARLGGFAEAEVYSTHATKLLNGFEGGYVTTDDDGLADLLRWQRNFALPGLRPNHIADTEQVLGVNAKLNELHAAMALLCLERLDGVIERNKARYERYRESINQIPGLSLLPCNDDAASKRNYQLAVIEVEPRWPLSRDQTLQLLKAEGAAISPYYSPPLHKSEHCPDGIEVPDLPVSENLATRYLQLPVGEHVSLDDVHVLADLLSFIAENGGEIASRMQRRDAYAKAV